MKSAFLVLLFGVFTVLFSEWNWISPQPTSTTYRGVAFGNGQFVIAGEYGTVLSSPDGINWTQRTTGTTLTLYNVNFLNGSFFAIGDSGVILTSTDGNSWTQTRTPTRKELKDIDYGMNKYVAVGDSGVILISSDGFNWTRKYCGEITTLHSIAFSGTAFMVGGSSGAYISIDLESWQPTRPSGYSYITTFGYGNGKFFCCALASTGDSNYSSTDGISWTPESGYKGLIRKVRYLNGKFYFIGYDSNSRSLILSSTTGAVLAKQTLPYGHDLFDIEYGNGTFVSVGYFGLIITSTNGTTWNSQRKGSYKRYKSIIYKNGLYVVVGDSGNIETSTDGSNWTSRNSGTQKNLNSLCHYDTQFVAVGESGTIITSLDGITWRSIISGDTNTLNGIAYGVIQFIAVGKNGTILTSRDAETWIKRTSGTSKNINAVVWGGNRYFTAGDNGELLSSPEGMVWTKRTNWMNDKTLRHITYSDSLYIAIGDNSCIMTSSNGSTWQYPFAVAASLKNVIWDTNNKYLIVGSYGTCASSLNGQDWIDMGLPASCTFYSAAYGPDKIVAVGDLGTIVSQPLITTLSENKPENNKTISVSKIFTYGSSISIALSEGFCNKSFIIGLYSVNGRQILTQSVNDASISIKINLPKIACGVYKIVLTNQHKREILSTLILR